MERGMMGRSKRTTAAPVGMEEVEYLWVAPGTRVPASVVRWVGHAGDGCGALRRGLPPPLRVRDEGSGTLVLTPGSIVRGSDANGGPPLVLCDVETEEAGEEGGEEAAGVAAESSRDGSETPSEGIVDDLDIEYAASGEKEEDGEEEDAYGAACRALEEVAAEDPSWDMPLDAGLVRHALSACLAPEQIRALGRGVAVVGTMEGTRSDDPCDVPRAAVERANAIAAHFRSACDLEGAVLRQEAEAALEATSAARAAQIARETLDAERSAEAEAMGALRQAVKEAEARKADVERERTEVRHRLAQLDNALAKASRELVDLRARLAEGPSVAVAAKHARLLSEAESARAAQAAALAHRDAAEVARECLRRIQEHGARAIARDFEWALRVEQRVARSMREAQRVRLACDRTGEANPAVATDDNDAQGLLPSIASLVSDFRERLDRESREASLALLRVASLRAAYATVHPPSASASASASPSTSASPSASASASASQI